MVESEHIKLIIEGGTGEVPQSIPVSKVLISIDKMHVKPGEVVNVEGYVWLQEFVPKEYHASVNLKLYVRKPNGSVDEYDTKTVYIDGGNGVSNKASWQISYNEEGEYEIWIESDDYASVGLITYGIAPQRWIGVRLS